MRADDAVINQIFRGNTVFPNNVKALFGVVRSLLEQGVHPDKIVRPADKWPLLACMSVLPAHALGPDFIALYRELVARGASVNKPVRGGHTPLSLLATASGLGVPVSPALRESLLACLLDAGAEPGLCRDSPLCSLIGFGKMKGDISGAIFEEAPGTPKYDAFWASVQRLIDAGADINAFERRGLYNPLLMAAICGSDHAVGRLIELGADPAVVNKDGNTALMYAAGDADGLASIVAGISCAWFRLGDTLAVTRLLLAQGVDPTLSNTRRRTALSIALRNECVDIAFTLAEALAAKGLLTTQDLKGFKGTAFEAQASGLAVRKPLNKVPAVKDASGTAQLASWEKLPATASGEDFASESALVRELLAPELRKQLYASYYDHLGGGLRLSTTKSWLSRKGCIDIRNHSTYDYIQDGSRRKLIVSTEFVVRHEALNHDSTDCEILKECKVVTGPDGRPDAAALKDVLIAILGTQLGVVS